jgi:hypothetical protein
MMGGAGQREWDPYRRGAADPFNEKDLKRGPTEENPTCRHL